MVGLYLHIPFCKSRCIYCGFYSTTLEEMKTQYVDSLIREIDMRQSESHDSWHTIYLGGGTPSRLSATELERLFSVIDCSRAVEITMECNPDDITAEYAALLGRLPINRVSMGAQTFSDERLRFIRRRHSAQQVDEAVERLRKAGINNISIDLMYGFPGETMDDWQKDIDHALSLSPEHLSAYSLMFEEGTALFSMLEKGTICETDEETSRAMYELLIDKTAAAGFEHYEISNFARPGFRSQHNSSYWNDTPYVGIGAAAHSYNQTTRSWNTADVKKYIESINCGLLPNESETLSPEMIYNDFVMLSLRTCEGINLTTLEQRFGRTMLDYCLSAAERFIADGLLETVSIRHTTSIAKLQSPIPYLRLTRHGIFVSDMIMSELFHISE